MGLETHLLEMLLPPWRACGWGVAPFVHVPCDNEQAQAVVQAAGFVRRRHQCWAHFAASVTRAGTEGTKEGAEASDEAPITGSAAAAEGMT